MDEETGFDSLNQLSSVSQLADVEPTDWAYQALRSLVERYGCIVGYPDGYFRGNRAISRDEFAAAVNACIDRVNELILAATEDKVERDDLVVLQRLMDEFQAELIALRGRIDALEGGVDGLEANQFSPSTKLFGQVVIGAQARTNNTTRFNLLNAFPFSQEDSGNDFDLISTVDLTLLSQLSPRDLVLTTLHGGVGSTAPRLSNDVALAFEGETVNSDGEPNLSLSEVTYRRLLNRRLAFIVGPRGTNMVNVFRGANRVEGAGQGPLSRFAQRNPIKNIGNGTAGVGLDWQVMPRLSVQTIYTANEDADELAGGLFGGTSDTTAGLQINWTPVDRFDVEVNYVYSHSPFGRLGTGIGDDQLIVLDGNSNRAPMNTHAVGGTLAWQATDAMTLGGWGGYTTSEFVSGTGGVQTINWMAFMNFPNLLGQGNLLGVFVGQPPKIVSSDLPFARNIPELETGDNDGRPGTTTHAELFFRYRLTDHISITPGVIAVFNPRHNPDNDTVVIGAVRTTFSF